MVITVSVPKQAVEDGKIEMELSFGPVRLF